MDEITFDLGDEEKQQAEALLQSFAERMKNLANEIIGDAWVELMPYIDTDVWSNVRTQFTSDLISYPEFCKHSARNAKELRKRMLREHREEIVNDTIRDLEEEIVKLLARIEEQRNDIERISRY